MMTSTSWAKKLRIEIKVNGLIQMVSPYRYVKAFNCPSCFLFVIYQLQLLPKACLGDQLKDSNGKQVLLTSSI